MDIILAIKMNYNPIIFNRWNLVIILSIFFLVYKVIKKRKIKPKISHQKKRSKNYTTGWKDDYFPKVRKISIDNSEQDESGFHVKLNYQILIERITRKLTILFGVILLSSIASVIFIFNYSESEHIAPKGEPLRRYVNMMDTLVKVEEKVLTLKSKELNKLLGGYNSYLGSSGSFSKQLKTQALAKTKTLDFLNEHSKNEDQMFTDTSNYFFKI